MAINPSVQLAPNVTAPDGNFPYGSAKDETAPGANDGTKYAKIRADDVFGLMQALLNYGDIVPTGNPDTALNKNSSQYGQSILHLVLSASTFTDVGAADAYILDVVDANPAPAKYKSNMAFTFIATNSNTGASTVNVESLGIKSIVNGGVALTADEILVGERITIIFDEPNDRFELVTIGNLGKALGVSLTLTGAATSPPTPNTIFKDNIVKGRIKFNGVGAISIDGSFNVDSIVDNGVGDYTIIWDTDFANEDYFAGGNTGASGSADLVRWDAINPFAVGSLDINTINALDETAGDSDDITIIAIGDQA